MGLADRRRRTEPFVGVVRRHAHVGDHDVGRLATHVRDERVTILDGRDHPVPRALEDADHALAQQRRVLGEDDRQGSIWHGLSIRSRVGPPTGLDTSRVPPSASSRVTSPGGPAPRLDRGTAAVVGDRQDEPVVADPRDHRTAAGAGVLDHVGEPSLATK